MDSKDLKQRQSSLFMNLILSFHSASMQHLGKIKSPVSGKIERDLAQAKMSIDMLDMIQAKTSKNLSEEEDKFLRHLISEAKLNYIDELNKDRAKESKKDSSEQK